MIYHPEGQPTSGRGLYKVTKGLPEGWKRRERRKKRQEGLAG